MRPINVGKKTGEFYTVLLDASECSQTVLTVAAVQVRGRKVGPRAPPSRERDASAVAFHVRNDGRPRPPHWQFRTTGRAVARRRNLFLPMVGVIAQAPPLCPPLLDGMSPLLILYLRNSTTF